MLVGTELKAGTHLCPGAELAGLGSGRRSRLSAIPGAFRPRLGVHQGAVQPGTERIKTRARRRTQSSGPRRYHAAGELASLAGRSGSPVPPAPIHWEVFSGAALADSPR